MSTKKKHVHAPSLVSPQTNFVGMTKMEAYLLNTIIVMIIYMHVTYLQCVVGKKAHSERFIGSAEFVQIIFWYKLFQQ